MTIEIGQILDGVVTGVTKFGAFVDLGDNISGMVHISEVASSYVNDINEFVSEGQQLKVKVINIDEKGKIALSIKQADPDFASKSSNKPARKKERSAPNVWNGPKEKPSSDNMSFEEMMAKFKSSSDEKMADLKRSTDTKHSGYGKRSGARR